MMHLLIYSDLHLESHKFTPPPAAVEQADVVILAGDIHEIDGLDCARKMFPEKPIIYVAGNHEFFDGHWTGALASMRDKANELGIHFLENDEITLGGVRFLGCTLWTDFLFFGQQMERLIKSECRNFMDDCRLIWRDGERRITPNDIQQRHQQSRSWLETALADGDPAKTVVITHHLPHQRCVVHRHKQKFICGAFASRLPASLIQRCGLWVHGHSHDSVRLRFGDARHETRVVSNPRGYYWPPGCDENLHFDPEFTVEFPWPSRQLSAPGTPAKA